VSDTSSFTLAERAGCLAEAEGLTSGKSQFSGEFLGLADRESKIFVFLENQAAIATRQNEARS
jgi:hypothetical protein